MVAGAIVLFPMEALGTGFLSLLVISVVVAPRMSVGIPSSKVAISFSDSVVFLSFLVYGPASSVILAASETIATCVYNERAGTVKFNRRYMFAINAAMAALGTAAACLVWIFFSRITQIANYQIGTPELVATLGILSIVQFLASSVLAAIFLSLQGESDFFTTWRKDCLPSSTSQFVGAGAAGVIYTTIIYGDVITATVALIVFGIVYLTYRQSIQQINTSIEQAEEAQRQKAEIERERQTRGGAVFVSAPGVAGTGRACKPRAPEKRKGFSARGDARFADRAREPQTARRHTAKADHRVQERSHDQLSGTVPRHTKL